MEGYTYVVGVGNLGHPFPYRAVDHLWNPSRMTGVEQDLGLVKIYKFIFLQIIAFKIRNA